MTVERPILGQLDALTFDLHGWLDRARAEVARLDALEERVADDYLRRLEAGQEGAAEAADRGLARVRRLRADAEARLAEYVADADAVPDEPDVDAWLDMHATLQRAVSGHVQGTTVQEVNERLREAVDRIVLTRRPDGSAGVRAYLSEAFLKHLDCTPDAFAAVSALNGGPRVIRNGYEFAADLAAAGEPPRSRLLSLASDGGGGPGGRGGSTLVNTRGSRRSRSVAAASRGRTRCESQPPKARSSTWAPHRPADTFSWRSTGSSSWAACPNRQGS